MGIPVENRDLLAVTGHNVFIVQQCNCLAVKSHGLSESIAKKFPYARVYERRRQEGKRNLAMKEDRPVPGTFSIDSDTGNNAGPAIVALFAQYDFGKDGAYYGQRPKEYRDTAENREKWFKESFESFCKHVSDQYVCQDVRVFIPFGIGCGLAGGNWDVYSKMLDDTAEKYREIDFVICKFTR